ncbi:conserved hypothetical protein [Talaromyces stipitatus ATCC 10500]|uniref:Uncharacterized protein n=1 Tax=Talaromyces stipitatus (strain ATCC 10500 / CBS 375.48 / QM 6759 / NRRL 1006) TaxID=441959 RepID=B8M5I3_TALSN|nr:uncharacterized protein TSTA_031370 [Talaromyces stipitatus ATCC 10500]EED19877.1 conserved hypothetical protein [Talaromyces stipitatus ATCC 10500]
MVSENVTPATASSGQRPTNTIGNVTADINKVDIIKSETDAPTDSHALAHAEVEETSLIRKLPGDEATSDIGWRQQPDEFDEPIIVGISNEDLYMLIRRFNKQVYHVRAASTLPLDNLDLNPVDDEEFSPDKLRSNIERLYMTVIVGLMSLWKHIVRLRSWREQRRTAVFCAAYFVAWLLDIIVPMILSVVIVLILYPSSRSILFPPAPIALVDSQTGGVQKPRAGVLGSKDSLTGAPERYRGEAVEQEASNLVSSVAGVAIGSAAGKHDPAVPDDAPMEDKVPDVTDVASQVGDLQDSAGGGIPSTKHDKTKKPMSDAVWTKMKPVMHILGDITDTYERFGNALSPTTPFPKYAARLRLAAILAPMALGSFFLTSYVVVKTSGFMFGFVFFGDPVLIRGAKYLNRRFPRWQKVLELRNSILKGVPTNAQLTITLLRLGEVNGTPIPSPPISLEQAPSKPASVHEDIPLDASRAEIESAVRPDPIMTKQATEPDATNEKAKRSKKKGFLPAMVRFFKGTTATGIETKLATYYALATLGYRHAKNHLGILPKKGSKATPGGPVDFQCRYQGKKGCLVIDSSKEKPVLFFTTEPGTEPPTIENAKRVLFAMPVRDIRHLKKLGGMGWKGKLVVGWAETEKEVIDGLRIIGKDPKQNFHITAMKTRDQLFNRLVAMGDQVWDIC